MVWNRVCLKALSGKSHGWRSATQSHATEWPVFHSLLSNTRMALFKAELDIAKAYSALVIDQCNALTIYNQIKAEFELTVDEVLRIAEQKESLEDMLLLHYSLSRRDPYLDPLNHIQITLIKRHRDFLANQGQDTELPIKSPWLDPLLRTINAIAAGIRNTG